MIENLRCEYLREPLGVDAANPRLSWIIRSDRRGWKQTAYRILVAASPEILSRDIGDLWDSGRVESDRSTQVAYAGQPLTSHQRCFWKARVWDHDGQISDWSRPTGWTMGFLDPADWCAKWIYREDPTPSVQLDIWWIWHPGEVTGTKYFVKTIKLDQAVESAEINISCDNRYELYVNGEKIGEGGDWKTEGRYQIAGLLKKGRNIIAVRGDYAGPGPAGLLVNGTIMLADQTKISIISDGDWKVSKTESAGWLNGELINSRGAKPVGVFGCGPWKGIMENIITGIITPSLWLRKTFTLEAEPEQALAYVNSLGYHELYVNGRKAGTNVLAPALSDFRARSFYVTYDIAPLLRKGQNCVGLWIGRGWHIPGPAARFQGEITAGGKNIRIVSDETWKCSSSSYSTLGRSMQEGGERFDARRDNPLWCVADYNDQKWTNVDITAAPDSQAESQLCPRNRVGKRIPAVSCRDLGNNRYEFDFGVDLAGWIRLQMKFLTEGQPVVIRYFDSGRQPYSQVDEFISAGRPREEFCSKFHYHGFRYAVIEGLPATPAPNDAEALLIESDLETTGSFSCSNELLNRIYRLDLWTIRCLNLGGYLVDCPHRERLGYGDGQVSAETCLMNFRMPNFYSKWLADWRHGQKQETGALPFTAPTGWGAGGPGWGGTLAALAWRTYLYYGDRRVLENCYEPMRRYVDYLENRCVNDILRSYGNGWEFIGDWVAPGRSEDSNVLLPVRPNELFNNCYRVYLWELLEKSASALGREDEARRCREKLDRIRPLIHREFYDPDKHTYVWEDQVYQCLPLMTEVTPPAERAAVLKKLEDGILLRRRGHLDTGMLGTYFLFKYLEAIRRDDLLLTIVNQKTYPGWGHMLEKGATTIWETWEGNQSHIHSCFTSVAGWFHTGLAGIRPDPAEPAFKKIIINPAAVGDLAWVKSSYESIHGLIISEWKKEPGAFLLNVTIPANTAATIFVRTSDPGSVTESACAATEADGVTYLRAEDDYAVLTVGSGKYSFIAVL